MGLKTFVFFIVLAGVAIQFIPYGKNHTNPAVVAEPQWDSPKTKALFTRVCANCHSNNTVWPWYNTIAPASWLMQRDVEEGRKHFNVSMWGSQKMNRGHDAAEEVQGGRMPPWYYVLGHPEAKLTENEKADFIAGLSATFKEGREINKP
jgi:mono/diheme cytochrome c family protein